MLRQAAATGSPSPPVNFQGVKFGQISSFYTVRGCRFRILIATIGAVLAIVTGHIRWIELAWLSIAASLLAIVVSETWPWDRKVER